MAIEKLKMLEGRISEVMEYVRKLKEEKTQLQNELMEKESTLNKVREELEAAREKEEELNRIKEERMEIRDRVEKILEGLREIGNDG